MSIEGTATTEYASLSGKIQTFVIDKSLSISGACADAQATGKEIERLESISEEAKENYEDAKAAYEEIVGSMEEISREVAEEVAKNEVGKLTAGDVDAYTKEETLSPSTKTALGLSEDAVPDDAFNAVASGMPKVGDILTTFRTDLGDKWLLTNGDTIVNNSKLGALLTANTIYGNYIQSAGTNSTRGTYSAGARVSYAYDRLFILSTFYDEGRTELRYSARNATTEELSEWGLTRTEINSKVSSRTTPVIYDNGMYAFAMNTATTGDYNLRLYTCPVDSIPNIENWTVTTLHLSTSNSDYYSPSAIMYDDGIWYIACTYNSYPYLAKVAASTGGATFTQLSTTSMETMDAKLVDGTMVILAKYSNNLFVVASNDGASWTTKTIGNVNSVVKWAQVGYKDGVWAVARQLASNATIYVDTATDPCGNWTTQTFTGMQISQYGMAQIITSENKWRIIEYCTGNTNVYGNEKIRVNLIEDITDIENTRTYYDLAYNNGGTTTPTYGSGSNIATIGERFAFIQYGYHKTSTSSYTYYLFTDAYALLPKVTADAGYTYIKAKE